MILDKYHKSSSRRHRNKQKNPRYAHLYEVQSEIHHGKHGVYCPQSHQSKLQYPTYKKALLAIKYGNGGVIRAYYCKCCRCYHTTCRQTFESGKYVPKQKHVNKYKDLKHG